LLSSNYIWVESTFCKGTTLLPDGSPGCDVKMISRSIDDRKRSAHYRQYYQAMKEKEAVNEAKLRYISCIAHDLKTPLQSFCFTVDLLSSSGLTAEQAELLEQTNVAVDLMKLTISQTMDISKALTGAVLQPHRRTVRLSLVIQRVRIIM
jgi:signal transduction histidine kinase